ncbi:conserved protein of unknown function [Rhodococcus sp. RD6.2]|nr:conserved protein of unknown function [Rhodococcus sp. RD6.2]
MTEVKGDTKRRKPAAPSRSRLALMRGLTGKVSPVKNGIGLLAEAVAERRRQLNLTLDQVKEAGGPSDVTTGKIEKALIADPSARTLRRLDVGLRWVDGSAARVLTGGLAVPAEEIPSVRMARPNAVGADADSVTLSLAVVNDLSDIAKLYERAAAAVKDEQVAGELRDINERLDLLVDRIMRAWLTAQLEQKTTEPSPLRGDPMIEMLLGDYLNRTPEPPTEEDADELQYLRWLTGRAGELDSATEQRFVAKWQSRQERTR